MWFFNLSKKKKEKTKLHTWSRFDKVFTNGGVQIILTPVAFIDFEKKLKKELSHLYHRWDRLNKDTVNRHYQTKDFDDRVYIFIGSRNDKVLNYINNLPKESFVDRELKELF